MILEVDRTRFFGKRFLLEERNVDIRAIPYQPTSNEEMTALKSLVIMRADQGQTLAFKILPSNRPVRPSCISKY